MKIELRKTDHLYGEFITYMYYRYAIGLTAGKSERRGRHFEQYRLFEQIAFDTPEFQVILHALPHPVSPADSQPQDKLQEALQRIAGKVPQCQCRIYGISCKMGDTSSLGRSQINFADSKKNPTFANRNEKVLITRDNKPPRRVARQHTWEAFLILY